MPKPCSQDRRERVPESVETGASRREPAERLEVSASSAIKWMQRWHETESVAAQLNGGSVSPLEKHTDWLLTLTDEQPGEPFQVSATESADCLQPSAQENTEITSSRRLCSYMIGIRSSSLLNTCTSQ